MNERKEDGFEEGFVQTCIANGLNVNETDELYKMALYAKAFDHKNFLEGFRSVTGPHRAGNMSVIEKAACIKNYLDSLPK